ncbi:MAG TPA: DUF3810 domain-containing protein [Agriterribacter sp.]|nr:DUF3810 domain-containing protein [Agriterribacter sp.]
MQNLFRHSIKSLLFLTCIAVCIRLFAFFPGAVENWYSTGIYPYIGAAIRTIFAFFPFSAGDSLYIFLFSFAVWTVIRLIKKIRRERLSWLLQKSAWLKTSCFCLLLYIIFNLTWGLNYDRKGIHYQMGFTREKYSKEELLFINDILVQQVNASKAIIVDHKIAYPSNKALNTETQKAFTQVAQMHPFLEYTHPSIKASFFNSINNYFGISGYYNPFTGEAQTNTAIPPFLQPFVNCHEVAHQLGYAKENEANFAGYLVATASGNTLFMYSAYFDLFLYANRNLYTIDSIAANHFLQQLHPGVKNDIEILKAYYKKYENPIEPAVNWVYDKYLRANDQPSGMATYNEVVADLIAYYKKMGKLNGLNNSNANSQ